MIELETKGGACVQVPEHENEDVSDAFVLSQFVEANTYYRENGYVVIRGLIEPESCDEVRSLWDTLVKPSDKPILRQSGDPVCRHDKNAKGWVMNPALDPHSMPQSEFRPFREAVVGRVFDTPPLAAALANLLGGDPVIVQSMYFEGNSATQEHQDSYYLDSNRIGELVAAWIALEDIAPKAGRFFVSPGSHLTDRCNVAGRSTEERHQAFIDTIKHDLHSLPIRAPLLKKGDVLFWHPLTIHGSLDSTDPEFSRSSLTCHAIRTGERLLENRSRRLRMPHRAERHLRIHYPRHPIGLVAKVRRSFEKTLRLL